MAEREVVIKEKLEHNGIFDFAALYSYIFNWLRVEEGYGVVEKKYAEKISGSVRSIEIEWSATKVLSDYFKAEIGIKWSIEGLTDVEVEIVGQSGKKKVNKGKIELSFSGILIRDYEGKWEVSPFYKFLRDAYNKYVIPSSVEDMQTKVSSTVISLKENIKSMLDLLGNREKRKSL